MNYSYMSYNHSLLHNLQTKTLVIEMFENDKNYFQSGIGMLGDSLYSLMTLKCELKNLYITYE